MSYMKDAHFEQLTTGPDTYEFDCAKTKQTEPNILDNTEKLSAAERRILAASLTQVANEYKRALGMKMPLPYFLVYVKQEPGMYAALGRDVAILYGMKKKNM